MVYAYTRVYRRIRLRYVYMCRNIYIYKCVYTYTRVYMYLATRCTVAAHYSACETRFWAYYTAYHAAHKTDSSQILHHIHERPLLSHREKRHTYIQLTHTQRRHTHAITYTHLLELAVRHGDDDLPPVITLEVNLLRTLKSQCPSMKERHNMYRPPQMRRRIHAKVSALVC